MEWISVKEKEPEDGFDCLIAVPLHNSRTNEFKRWEVSHATYRAQERWSYFTTCEGEDFVSGEDVFHWMPLPDPPQEQP